MKIKSNIICLVGPSGIGKTSYIRQLAHKHQFKIPKVVTTRCPRQDDDQHFKYVKKDNFFEMIDAQKFIEWDEYAGYFYGTLMKDVYRIINEQFVPILDLTPTGCLRVKKKEPNALIIAIVPDDPIWLHERLKMRNSQSVEEITERSNLLYEYLKKIESLNCHKVHAHFSPSTWPETLREIENLIF